MSRPQTRAQYLGVMPGRLAARTGRRVAKIRALLVEIAADWDEADSAVGFECDVLIDAIDNLDVAIEDGVTNLRGPAPE